MILLMEGFDRTGKTTLGTMLADELHLPVCHFGVPPVEPRACFDYFRHGLADAQKAYPAGYVLDRFHLSNAVYGPLLGGGILDEHDYRLLDYHLANMQATLILMCDKPHTLQERLQQEDEEVIRGLTVAQVGEMQNQFGMLFDQSQVPYKSSFTLRQFVDEGGVRTAQFRELVSALFKRQQQVEFLRSMME